MQRVPLLLLGAAAMLVPAFAATAAEAPVGQDRLNQTADEPHNWLMPNGNYTLTRYSTLSEINHATVAGLRMAFAYALGGMRDTGESGPQNEGAPLVEGGHMYVADGWGTIYKLDVSSGRRGVKIWTVDGKVEHEGNSPRTRGVALVDDWVLGAQADGRVIAVDRSSGEFIWDRRVGAITAFGAKETFTAAPIVFDNRVIVANGAGDSGTRGWIAALDLEYGEEEWRFWTVPGPGEPGHESWLGNRGAWQTGGGGLWQSGSVDVEQRLTIWGTGNPVPPFDPQLRPGDNLYTDSAVAVDLDTGALRWYFQYVPNESWNHDEIGSHILYEAVVNGIERKVVGHFGRNGFFYQMDRVDGSFLSGIQYVEQLDWTVGLDPVSGKPVEYDPNLEIQHYRVRDPVELRQAFDRTCAVWHGGIAQQPQAYNPVKRLAYGAGAEGCVVDSSAANRVAGAAYASDRYYGAVTAVNVTTGKVAAKAIFDFENQSGVLVAAGGLVFTGTPDGDLLALDDETLDVLWSVNIGTPIKSAPMTYAIGSRQFVAVVTSGRDIHPIPYGQLELSSYVFVFSL